MGAALAALLSLAIVPLLISDVSTIATGTVVSFSPLIYIGAAIFALLTALLGAANPAKRAAIISPIEAQKYTGTEVKKIVIHSSVRGKPDKMALRNIFRDRKRATVVLLSLFLGVTTFITITTLISGMNTDNYIASYMENDFMLTNNTVAFGTGNEPKQKFDGAFLSAMQSISGFEHMQYDTKDWFKLTYTDDFEAHLTKLLEREPGITSEGLSAIGENFIGIAVGVDGNTLNGLDGNFDIGAFERGEYLLFATDDPSLYQGVKSVEVISGSGDVFATIPVGGCVPQLFHNNGYCTAPTLVMSNSLMEKLTGGAIRSMLYIDVAQDSDAQFLKALKSLTDGDYEISRIKGGSAGRTA